jgi:hypothetical protein
MSSATTGLAPQLTPLKTSEKIVVDVTYKKVLQTLARHRSMAFLELTSVCDINDTELSTIIKDLESEDVVKVTNPYDITEELITLKHKGFAIASTLAY